MADQYVITKIKAKVWKKHPWFFKPFKASNQPVFANGRAVAATTTTHYAAVDEKLDVCWLIGVTPPMSGPFFNEIHVKHLKTGATTSTSIKQYSVSALGISVQIHDGWVWISRGNDGYSGGLLEAVRSYPNYPLKGLGVKSGTDYGWAGPTSSSTNVFIEGFGVVRDQDTTLQNSGNATGIVNGPRYKVKYEFIKEKLKKKCSLVSMTGHCAHGRVLGYKSDSKEIAKFNQGESPMPENVVNGDYLEVTTDGERLTFEAKIEDSTVKGGKIKPGECEIGTHPQWTVTRTGKGSWPWVPGNKEDTEKAKEKIEISGRILKVATPFFFGERRMLSFLARWKEECPTILVKVTACSGVRPANILILPSDPAKYTWSKEGEEVEKWSKEKLGALKKVEDVVKKVIDFAKKLKIDAMKVEVCKRSYKSTFSARFKELTKNKNGCTWVQANLAWEMKWAFDPLVGLRYEFDLGETLMKIAPAMPFFGNAIAALMKVNSTLKIFKALFIIELTHNVGETFGLDEYRTSTRAGESDIKLVMGLSCQAKLYKFAAAEVRAGVEGKLSLVYEPNAKSYVNATGKGKACLFYEVIVFRNDRKDNYVFDRGETPLVDFSMDAPWKLF